MLTLITTCLQVLIEAGSASSFGGSFDLSPRLASHSVGRRGSREQVHQDVESELQEAMSETVIAEESLLAGKLKRFLAIRFCGFLFAQKI